MAGVTNRIPFDEAADLLTGARACLAFVVDGAPHVEPAVVRAADAPERFLVGIDGRAGPVARIIEADEAVLVIDDGLLFFDLRAIYVRGTPSAAHVSVDEAEPGRVWLEIEPTKVTCWDYGRLRTAEHAP